MNSCFMGSEWTVIMFSVPRQLKLVTFPNGRSWDAQMFPQSSDLQSLSQPSHSPTTPGQSTGDPLDTESFGCSL